MLHVQNALQSKEAIRQVVTLNKAFTIGEIDKLSDEWLEYMSEEIPEDWYCHTSENTDDEEDDDDDTAQSDQVVKYERINVYWSKVGKMTRPTGERKYPALLKPARIALTLIHGNADVEQFVADKPQNEVGNGASLLFFNTHHTCIVIC